MLSCHEMTTQGASIMNFYIDHRSSKQCRWITLSVMLVFVLAGVVLTGRASSAETDECISKPNAPAPQGSHWYYRTDRTSKRQCWYLGEEGAKARASERLAGTTVPTPPPKPVLQPLPKYRDDVALVEPAVSGGAEKSPRLSVASIEWQPLPSSAFSTGDTTLQRNQHSTVTSADDLPVKSPTPAPANQPPAGEPVQHAIGLGALFAVLGGALSIAILIYRIVRGTASRSKLRESQTTASEPANVAEQAPPNFVPTIIATNAQADQLQNRITEQGDQNGDIEASVRRLLQELQRRYSELHGHDFKPTSESPAPPSYGR
jgi:hypothetical protein